jgi:hypothetical protein
MYHLKKAMFLMFVLSFFSVASVVQAQDKPNVSGTWKMNAEKTKFEQGGPRAVTIKFDHLGSSLSEVFTIANDGGERTANFAYTLDGSESKQRMGDEQVTAAARWEGESLVIELKNNQGNTFLRKITVSADGKTMTIDVKQSRPNASTHDIVVLEKQ